MHKLLPDRRRFGLGRISFIALAEDIEIAGKKDGDSGGGSKNDPHRVCSFLGTHMIRLFLAVMVAMCSICDDCIATSAAHPHVAPFNERTNWLVQERAQEGEVRFTPIDNVVIIVVVRGVARNPELQADKMLIHQLASDGFKSRWRIKVVASAMDHLADTRFIRSCLMSF
jgi:hypothetical protein